MLDTTQIPTITPSQMPKHEGISDSSFGLEETKLEEIVTAHNLYLDDLGTWLKANAESPISDRDILPAIREYDEAEQRLDKFEETKQDALTKKREQLRLLDPNDKHSFSAIINEQAPEFFRGRYEAWAKTKKQNHAKRVVGSIGMGLTKRFYDSALPTIQRWVGDTDNQRPNWADYLANEADDAELVNFMQWYTYRLEMMAKDPKIQAEIKTQKTEYKKALIEGIELGYIHSDAKVVVPRIDNTSVVLGDYTDTYSKLRSAYAKQRSGIAVIGERNGPDAASMTSIIRKKTKHEVNHSELGLFRDLWLDEAVTEHSSQAFENGQWEIVDPKLRNHDSGVYREFRTLWAAIIDSGVIPVPVRYWTRAWSAQTKEHRKQAMEELDSKLEQAYGIKNLIPSMGRLLETFSNGITKDHPEIEWADRQAAKELVDGWRNPETRQQIIDELKYMQDPATQVAA